jgi:3-deoxy-D-manno-octulosonic acid kinase
MAARDTLIRETPDFEVVDHPGARGLARPDAIPWVRFVLEGGDTLHGSAKGDREALTLAGRKPVYVIPAKVLRENGHPTTRWAVRRFARGGRVLPKILGDRFLRWGTPRPVHETRVSEEARRRGVPTPRVMAAMTYPQGPFYRGDLVTEFVPGATDLVESLFDTRRKGLGGATERLDALKAAGALIVTMSRAGLRHEDLHAGNILLQWEGAAPRGLILDLDRAHLLSRESTASPGTMLRRLKRSLRKWESRTGLRISQLEWDTLAEAVMG